MRPNFDEYAATSVKDPAYDPGNKFSMAWQSGLTGHRLGPRAGRRAPPRQPHDHQHERPVRPGVRGQGRDVRRQRRHAEPRDDRPGHRPRRPRRVDDWKAAAEKLTQPARRRHRAAVLRAELHRRASNGDVALTMAWSGDIFQTKLSGDPRACSSPCPTEGAMHLDRQHDDPQGAENPVDAMTLHGLRLRPRDRGPDERSGSTTSRRCRTSQAVRARAATRRPGDAGLRGRGRRARSCTRRPRTLAKSPLCRVLDRRRAAGVERHLPAHLQS